MKPIRACLCLSSFQLRKSETYVGCQPRIAPPQLSRWGGEPALSLVAGRDPRVLALPNARRGRVASSILLRARGSCESLVPDPSDAAQGDPAKGAVGKVCGHTSGLFLPLLSGGTLTGDGGHHVLKFTLYLSIPLSDLNPLHLRRNPSSWKPSRFRLFIPFSVSWRGLIVVLGE